VTVVLPAPNRSDWFGKSISSAIKQQVSKNKCKASTSKIKSRICYPCRSKGHESNECPNGNIPMSKLVNYAFSRLRDDKNGIYATRVISSPQTSIRAIWTFPNLLWLTLKNPT
jgi:hypothetical protein